MKKTVLTPAQNGSHENRDDRRNRKGRADARAKRGAGTAKSVIRLLSCLEGGRWLFVLSLILSALCVFATLYFPVLTGDAIDLLVSGAGTEPSGGGLAGDLKTKLLVMSALTAVHALASWLLTLLNNHISYSLVRNLRSATHRRLSNIPLSYLDTRPVGDLVSRMVSDAEQVSDGLLLGLSQLFTGVITIAATVGFLFGVSPVIAVWVVVATPLSMLAGSLVARKTHAYFTDQAVLRAEQTSYIEETVGKHKTVVALCREDGCVRDFDDVNLRLEKQSVKAVFASSLVNPVTRFVNNLVYAGAAFIGCLIAIFKPLGFTLTVGEISCVLAYATQYTKPFNEISGVITELQNSLICADRLFALADAPDETRDDTDASNGIVPRGTDIRISHIDFGYTPERTVIRDLSFSCEAGRHIAVVGPTGAGKTTLLNLLMRFYPLKGGEIYVGGVEIREMSRGDLRRRFGMVLQDSWLCRATVAENIAFGRPDATLDEVVEAAEAAYADTFIRALPNGYQTVLGEDGAPLSGGQKQLLCIARAFLCRPDILIFDEATSSVDTRTEAKIQQALERLTEGRTSFVVAHRLSTVRDADVIIVMQDGQIIETGNHEELMEDNGLYAQMIKSGRIDRALGI